MDALEQELVDFLTTPPAKPKSLAGYLGYPVDDVFDVVVPEDTSKYRIYSETGEFVEAYHCNKAAPHPGLRVFFEWDADLEGLAITGIDQRYARTFAGEFAGSLSAGPHSHEIGSGLEFPIDDRLLAKLQLRVFAGLTIEITPGPYFDTTGLKWWPGGTLDLTSYVPGSASTWAWVVIGINPATPALVAVAGTARSVVQALDESAIPTVGFNWTDHVQLAAVRLRNGQTELVENDFEAILVVPHALPGAGGGSIEEVQSNGVALPSQPAINIIGNAANIVATDDAANDRTNITLFDPLTAPDALTSPYTNPANRNLLLFGFYDYSSGLYDFSAGKVLHLP